MPDEVKVDPDLLESDAENYWQDGATRMDVMIDQLPVVDANDFSIIPGAAAVAAGYATARSQIAAYIRGGADEYLRFEHALLRAAIVYESSHGASVDDIDRLTKELGS